MNFISQNRILIRDNGARGTIVINIEDIKYSNDTASYSKYKRLDIDVRNVTTFEQEYNEYKGYLAKYMENYVVRPLTKIIERFL